MYTPNELSSDKRAFYISTLKMIINGPLKKMMKMGVFATHFNVEDLTSIQTH